MELRTLIEQMVLDYLNESADKKVISYYKKMMPSGTKVEVVSGKSLGLNVDKDFTVLKWGKRGGHAGDNSILATVKKAKAAGFKKNETKHGGIPDGSRIDMSTVLQDDNGAMLTYTSSYGATASGNWYLITLILPDIDADLNIPKAEKKPSTTKHRKIVKVEELLNGRFEPSEYKSIGDVILNSDGKSVYFSLLYKKKGIKAPNATFKNNDDFDDYLDDVENLDLENLINDEVEYLLFLIRKLKLNGEVTIKTVKTQILIEMKANI